MKRLSDQPFGACSWPAASAICWAAKPSSWPAWLSSPRPPCSAGWLPRPNCLSPRAPARGGRRGGLRDDPGYPGHPLRRFPRYRAGRGYLYLCRRQRGTIGLLVGGAAHPGAQLATGSSSSISPSAWPRWCWARCSSLTTRAAASATVVDILGALLVTATPALAVYTIIQASETGWAAPLTLALGGAALVLALSFVLIESRSSHPWCPCASFARAPSRANLVRALPHLRGCTGCFFLGASICSGCCTMAPCKPASPSCR